ncbi:MAG: 6-bladed beta-propeller [Bacteroidales bacterium]|nr:6-bladed beta-propeller [Bacteroidales bacterium]
MKRLTGLLLAGILISVSCNRPGSVKDPAADLPYAIDLERDIGNVRSVPLSTLGKEVEYIPLETGEGSMLRRVANVIVCDSLLFVSDGSTLFLFGRSGEFIRQIGTSGRGPGEYNYVRNFNIDRNNQDIYILALPNVMVFGFDGKYRRSFSADYRPSQVVMKDENTLMFHLFNMSGPSPDTAYSWYITDKEGVVLSKIRNHFKRVSQPGIIVPNSPLYVHDGSPRFLEFGMDTLYYFKNSVMTPYAIFNRGKLKMDPDLHLTPDTYKEVTDRVRERIWISEIIENSRYLFVNISWGLSDSVSRCLFEKENMGLTVLKENGFEDDQNAGPVFWPKFISEDNTMVDHIDALRFLQIIRSEKPGLPSAGRKASERLERLEKELTETSNPVLMLVR